MIWQRHPIYGKMSTGEGGGGYIYAPARRVPSPPNWVTLNEFQKVVGLISSSGKRDIMNVGAQRQNLERRGDVAGKGGVGGGMR